MSTKDQLLVKNNILKKLYSHGAFAKGHMLKETLSHGIPKHLVGLVDDALKELVREGLVVIYGKTKHGQAYQLNMEKLSEIEALVLPKDVQSRE